MDIQEETTVEIREGNLPNPSGNENPKVTSEIATKPLEEGHKATDRLEGKKTPTRVQSAAKQSKTSKPKASKHKKHLPAQGSSSESYTTDSDTSSDWDSKSTGSDSEVQRASKNMRNANRRSGTHKSKTTKGRKQKNNKRGQATAPDPGLDSDYSSESRGIDDDGKGAGEQDLRSRLRSLQILELQQQLQQLRQKGARNHDDVLVADDLPPPTRFRAEGQSSSRPREGWASKGMTLAASRPPGGAPLGRDGRLGDIDVELETVYVRDGNQKRPKKETTRHKASGIDFKRVDQVWDNKIHDFKLQDTALGSTNAQYDDFLFHVRRMFNWEGKYTTTLVDIKSKLLRECLKDVMGDVKGVSLVEETPKLDPNMLFLFLEDLRTYLKRLEEEEEEPFGDSRHQRKKQRHHIKAKRRHLKVLVKYIDNDYADVKKSLYPMLENGLITFDLLWALWKPNTLAFTTTYGSHDEPRVFKVETAEKHHSIMQGDFYYIGGKYFEYDGKQFGYGSISEDLGDFRGARKITSLACYPLKYHKNEPQLRKDLIARGKKFVALSGVHYKSHQGMAYYKKKKTVVKVNINGRIMVDPQIHRRINPNYPVSTVRPKDHDMLLHDEGSADDSAGPGCGSESDADEAPGKLGEPVKYVAKLLKDDRGEVRLLRVPKLDQDEGQNKERLEQVAGKYGDVQEEENGDAGKKSPPEFGDEEYLIAAPVVLGFAFSEKLWLELTVSGVKEIQWNKDAYQSLVLEPKTKDIVKALVESHKYHAAESIDDVIQGKGKGLVAVLHGPPGTGKTLTAEGISESLKCPLYMASAGELGTNSRFLESELQKILDICHAWGAILLLDEADVFLEKRNMHDIQRNALVSIFLRQLEYFQGILFLTTNRVETFDDAFQSRIHIALRYDRLDQKAKRSIFKIFIERVRLLEKIDLMPFTEEDFNVLARHELNGRQIKNTVRTAQALAVNKGEPLSMNHIRQVLEVQMSFDRDLKGGTGYQDAMRSYF